MRTKREEIIEKLKEANPSTKNIQTNEQTTPNNIQLQANQNNTTPQKAELKTLETHETSPIRTTNHDHHSHKIANLKSQKHYISNKPK